MSDVTRRSVVSGACPASIKSAAEHRMYSQRHIRQRCEQDTASLHRELVRVFAQKQELTVELLDASLVEAIQTTTDLKTKNELLDLAYRRIDNRESKLLRVAEASPEENIYRRLFHKMVARTTAPDGCQPASSETIPDATSRSVHVPSDNSDVAHKSEFVFEIEDY